MVLSPSYCFGLCSKPLYRGLHLQSSAVEKRNERGNETKNEKKQPTKHLMFSWLPFVAPTIIRGISVGSVLFLNGFLQILFKNLR